MSEVIRVKRKDVRKILCLYTMEGYTQKEIASIVLGDGDIKGVSTYTVVQRVLHYLGINMEYRKDYKHEGLTPEMIDRIMDNRMLAYPIAVPVEGNMQPAIIFDDEVKKCLGIGSNKYSSSIKNLFVLIILVALTYFSQKANSDNMAKIIIIVLTIGPGIIITFLQGYKNQGFENSKRKK